ncbi:MAG: SMI1/KNR4 family protein [Reyranellaceae bacterium]
MSIYLVRYLINPTTRGRRQHLLLEDSNWVLGQQLPDGDGESNRYFEQTFERADAAVLAFERLLEQSIADGYLLTDVTDRFASESPDDANPKPAWQHAIDRYYLAMLHGDYDIALPDEPLARAEPIWMHLDAIRAWRFDKARAAEALPFALAARAELQRRKAEKRGYYTWSLPWVEEDAGLDDLLFGIYSQLGDKDNAFAAIRAASDLATNTYRSERLAAMQCYAFPQYREDAFDTAHRYAQYGYGDVIAHPDYAAYAARREAEIASGQPILRWRAMCDPSSPEAIAAAERDIGARLPDDYRDFLLRRGKSRLDLSRGDDLTTLTFAAAPDISIWGSVFRDWLDTMSDKDEGYSKDWARELGVDRSKLWSIATPWDNSRCLVMSLAGDETHGRCYLWDHDDAYLLVPIGDSFAEALATIESGFVSGDKRVGTILG